jgi:hypothetical protein
MTNDDAKMSKKKSEISCKNCDFKCFGRANMTAHKLLCNPKNDDKMMTNDDAIKNVQELSDDKPFGCGCGKHYKYRQGLFVHKKKCLYEENMDKNGSPEDDLYNEKHIILTLLQQNNQLQNQIIELCKEKTITNINNTSSINSHNKSFNLNFFLNETCKDAMNIMDFVDSIKLQLSDLEKVGEIGYVDGISNIITSNLKALDVTQRPIHCTDKKRDVLYVKDQNKWEKEDDEKNKLRKAIKRVACKNQRLIPKFKEAHPDCIKAASRFSDQYNKMIIESMGGSGDNDLEKEDKIIKKITKEVIINKNLEIE